MQQDNLSFWTDIKTFEEQLSRSPNSFCFAKLSEIYLKVGLIFDALHTARHGVAKHPRYLAGLRALAMACHADGIKDECIAALKLVTEAMPEDHQALMLLGRLLVDTGDRDAARQAFKTALEFVPDDLECRTELKFLEVSGESVNLSQSVDEDDDEEIIEDLEIIEDFDDFEEDQPVSDLLDNGQHYAVESTGEPHHDPLSTATLAGLYVKQGFINKALEIYRSILTDDPGNSEVSTRIKELEHSESVSTGLNPQGTADNALSILENWLDNVMRVKSCR